MPALDGRWVVSTADDRALTYVESTRRARGEIGYPAPGEKVIGNLIGAPIRSRFVGIIRWRRSIRLPSARCSS